MMLALVGVALALGGEELMMQIDTVAGEAQVLFGAEYVLERFRCALHQLKAGHGSTTIPIAASKSSQLIALCEASGMRARVEPSFSCSLFADDAKCRNAAEGFGTAWVAIDYGKLPEAAEAAGVD